MIVVVILVIIIVVVIVVILIVVVIVVIAAAPSQMGIPRALDNLCRILSAYGIIVYDVVAYNV